MIVKGMSSVFYEIDVLSFNTMMMMMKYELTLAWH